MELIYWVDLPNPNADDSGNGPWVNVAKVKSRKEAYKLLKDRWGIEKKDAEMFISCGQE